MLGNSIPDQVLCAFGENRLMTNITVFFFSLCPSGTRDLSQLALKEYHWSESCDVEDNGSFRAVCSENILNLDPRFCANFSVPLDITC